MRNLDSSEIQRLAKFEMFHGLSYTDLAKLFSNALVKNLKHREILYGFGERVESFGVVIDGALKLIRHSPRGDDIIVHFAIAGDFVGALLLNQTGDVTFPITIKSMGPTQVACIPRATFESHWKANAQIQGKLNSALYKRMSNIQDDKALFSSPLKIRMAGLLLRHLDKEVETVEQKLSLPLTRQEIADSLGVAVESVIRAMSEWQEEGIIQRTSPKGPDLINVAKLLECVSPST